MKRKIKIIILTLLCLLYVYRCGKTSHIFNVELPFWQTSAKIRELSLKVVDAETKQPLKDIPIIYILSSTNHKYTFFALIPTMDSDTYEENEKTVKLKTDKNGEVKIPKDVIKLNWPRVMDTEKIIVNLDFTEKVKEKEYVLLSKESYNYFLNITSQDVDNENLLNPIKEYKGYKIFSSRSPTDPLKSFECGSKSCFYLYPPNFHKNKPVSLVIPIQRK